MTESVQMSLFASLGSTARYLSDIASFGLFGTSAFGTAAILIGCLFGISRYPDKPYGECISCGFIFSGLFVFGGGLIVFSGVNFVAMVL